MTVRLNRIITFLLAFVLQIAFSQETTITGVVLDESGPLSGVSIIIEGTTTGAETDPDGNYTIDTKIGDVLRFSFVGMTTMNRVVGKDNVINVTMVSVYNTLDEIVITGVAGETSKKKLSITVATVRSEELEKVPAGSAASALQGKVAGVTVINLGRPGAGADIILRGPTNFYGTQLPLIIMDGIYVEGGLSDINVQDIESFEIVKGASASSLYGSRAGNGVIVITTKRGKYGKLNVTIRFETGFSQITNFMDTNQSHAFELASDWEDFKGQYTKYEGVTYGPNYQSVYAASGDNAVDGSRIQSPYFYSDNPYGVYHDFQDDFFKKGFLFSSYAAISSGSEKSSIFFSNENLKNEGVLTETDGYSRNSFRINADFYINDWLTFKTSNNFIKAHNNFPGGGNDIYRTVSRLSPDANVNLDNPDGQPYYYKPDPWENEISNPLYLLYNQDSQSKQQIFLGGYNLKINFTDYLNLYLEYSFESDNNRLTRNAKYETYTTTGDPIGFGYSEGSLFKRSSFRLSQRAQATLNFVKQFGYWDIKAKLSYLAEDDAFESFETSGQNYLYEDLPTFDNFDQNNVSASSTIASERAQNYFVIAGFVYKDRYIFDGLFRRDGSSLFGANNRWNNYYRVSAAWRVTKDIDIPGFQELKLNIARGTAGQRPGFSWQYELTELNLGVLSTDRTKGNPDLKPSLTTENEIGLIGQFLKRFTFEFAYSNQVTSDQFMIVNLFSPANAGKNKQWQNVGDMESNTYEFTFNSKIIEKDNIKWGLGINFTSIDSKITKLNAPEQFVGSNNLFLLREDTEFGSMYGRKFIKDLETMSNQLPDGDNINEYSINSDGVVVKTVAIGTADEKAIIEIGDDGNAVIEEIGNQNADFRVGIRSHVTYKNFNFYMLWDWKQGGDIYNLNAQWITISERNAIVDQAGKADSDKKTTYYYASLYDTNRANNFWVEDGSYVKLREMSLRYALNEKILARMANGFFSEFSFSLIGRNLINFTDYKGWDPEVASFDGGTQQYFSVDYGVYPTQTTYSFALQLKF